MTHEDPITGPDSSAERDVPARRGLVARALLWMLDFYQKGISPLYPPSCRFEPSCSRYAMEAVTLHGSTRGTLLSVWRLLRCGPWTRGGWDPVPEPRTQSPPEPEPDPGPEPDPEHHQPDPVPPQPDAR